MRIAGRRWRGWQGRVMALAALALACGDDAGAEGDPTGRGDAATFAACSDSLPEFAVGLTAQGEHGRIRATLLDASRFPPRKYENRWTLELAGPDGAALADAEITELTTFMPVHGHYGRPDATFETLPQPGQVRARVHFTMRGPWQVRIEASSADAGDDSLVFDVCVEE